MTYLQAKPQLVKDLEQANDIKKGYMEALQEDLEEKTKYDSQTQGGEISYIQLQLHKV